VQHASITRHDTRPCSSCIRPRKALRSSMNGVGHCTKQNLRAERLSPAVGRAALCERTPAAELSLRAFPRERELSD
jgi:hypothetical protein